MQFVVHSVAMLVMALSLAGCSGPEPAAGRAKPPASTTTAAGTPGPTLKVWAEEAIAPAIESLGEEHQVATGVRVVVNPYPLEDMITDLARVAPRGLGPDLLVGSSDWVGTLSGAGLITKIAIDPEARFRTIALEAFTLRGRVYGIPLTTQAPALMRNTDLVPDQPGSIDAMADEGLRLKRANKVDLPIALPVGSDGDAFHWYPLYAAAGGFLFERERDGNYDPDSIGVGLPASVRAARDLADLAERGAIDPHTTRRSAIRAFRSGRAAFLIAEPSAVDRFSGSGIRFAVGPIPGDGSRASGPPLVAARGFMQSAFARDARAARAFLDRVTTTRSMEALTAPGTQVPAWTEASAAASADPVLHAFTQVQDAGRPVPNVSAMPAVWRILGQAQVEVLRGVDPPRAMADAGTRIAEAVASE